MTREENWCFSDRKDTDFVLVLHLGDWVSCVLLKTYRKHNVFCKNYVVFEREAKLRTINVFYFLCR